MRSKLKRWRITEVPEGTLARRACNVLRSAFDTTPVRVANVLFRTLLNGWCTARRFQTHSSTCLFRCAPGSLEGCHDSIEHYAHCPVVRQFSLHILKLPAQVVGNLQGFLCLHVPVDANTLIVQHLLLYAVYTATNRLRHGPAGANPTSHNELLLQYVHQGAGQSPSSKRAVRAQLQLMDYKRRRLSVVQTGQDGWSTDDDCEPECTRTSHRCIKSSFSELDRYGLNTVVRHHFATASSARSTPTAIDPHMSFIQGGDHFMTTSFTSHRT